MSNPYLNKKYTIVSGCSYGHFATGIELSTNKLRSKFIKETQQNSDANIFDSDTNFHNFVDKNVVVNLQHGGQTNTYIVDSIIYTTEYLLSKGVSAEDIYVLVEFSNLERHSSHNHTHRPSNVELDIETDSHKHILSLNNNSDLFKDYKINCSKISTTAVYLDELLYMSSQGVNSFDTPHDKYLKSYLESITISRLNTPIQTSIKEYLDTILRLQWYLKSKSVSYNCCNINSQFSHWIDLKETITRKSMLTSGNPYCNFRPPSELSKAKNLDYQDFYKSTSTDDLVNIYPPIKNIFNLIDFSKWWFYDTDIYRYGGIDEYTIDNHDWYGYSKTSYDGKDSYNNIPSYFNHPAEWVYIELWNSVALNSKIKYTQEFLNWISTNVKKYKDIAWSGGEVKNEFINTDYINLDMFKHPKEVRLGKK